MGLFDTLFGGGSKPEEAPKKQSDPVAAKPAVTTSADLNSEIVAAIAASINCVMDTSLNAELLAAITAAVVHHGGGVHAVKIQHTSNAWGLAGRQKLMDSRQFA
ncbi:MAG TPA: hypothetical protein VN631_01795 [Negativicutes bacterium]|nr:hypothetical protein [Negativicutes bacterium]